ncbi:MAG TPA: hypothetical protein VGC66_22255 [Pyrinomonadaceae bacterium]|jgi:hypothetical protein
MARRKRTSPVLETAHQRLAGLKSITPAPNFGSNLQLADYEQEISEFSDALDNYNEELSALDEVLNSLGTLEKSLNDKNKRMLAATGAQFGPDSSQYEQAGGTRLSERKRPSKKAPSKG